MEGFDFVHRERVRFRDLDSLGHVNNAVFLTYLEEARIGYLVPHGAAAANIEADDSMVIGGGIGPGKAKGQEGQLRAVAVVIARPGAEKREKVAIVACDVLFVQRDFVDRALQRIEKSTGIPAARTVVWELEGFGWKWNLPAAGIIDVQVRPDLRKQGLGKLLVSQILRFLQDQFFAVAELQAPAANPAAVGMCQSLGFEQVDEGFIYRRASQSEPEA